MQRCSLGTALLKKYAFHAKIPDGDHLFKMADMSGKEIINFGKKCAYLFDWDDHGVKSYSLEHVENEFGHVHLPGSFFLP